MIQDLTPDLAEALRLPRTAGAVIASVEEDTPAERAGLRPGDIVVAVNGRAVEDSADLRNTIGLTRAGSEVELTVLRDGREITVSARLGPGDRVSTAPSGRIGRELAGAERSEEHTSELQSLMRNSYGG